MAKWSIPKILLGCVVLVVLLCAGGIGAVFFFFPNLVNWLQTEYAKAQEWEQFATTWQAPPPDAGPERLFPPQVEAFHKEKDDDHAALPNLGIQLPGRRAIYRSGQDTVEVCVYRATKAEQEGIFQQVMKTQEQGSAMKIPVDTGTYARLPFSRGKENGVLWWSRDWLFVVRSQEPLDPEPFLRSYLEAVSKLSAPDKKPTGATTPSTQER